MTDQPLTEEELAAIEEAATIECIDHGMDRLVAEVRTSSPKR
jgi:hypothetical protein